MVKKRRLAVIEQERSEQHNVIELMLWDAPEWSVVEMEVNGKSWTSVIDILRRFKRNNSLDLDAIMLNGNLTDQRLPDGTVMAVRDRFEVASKIAQELRHIIPEIPLIGFGEDAKEMEDVLHQANVELDANIETNYPSLPAVLDEIIDNPHPPVAA